MFFFCLAISVSLLRNADSWIDHAVKNIDQQHNADIHGAVDKAQRNDYVIVVTLNRRYQQTANAGNRKDFFHNEAARPS